MRFTIIYYKNSQKICFEKYGIWKFSARNFRFIFRNSVFRFRGNSALSAERKTELQVDAEKNAERKIVVIPLADPVKGNGTRRVSRSVLFRPKI